MAGKGAGAKAPARRGSLLWLQGLICGAVVAVAPAVAALSVVLMLPGIIVLVVDGTPGKASARPVLLLGLATALRPLAEMWRNGQGIDRVAALAGDPQTLVVAWAVQGLAWLFVELAPLFIILTLEAAAQGRALRLRASRAGYERDWDVPPVPAVAQAATPAPTRPGAAPANPGGASA